MIIKLSKAGEAKSWPMCGLNSINFSSYYKKNLITNFCDFFNFIAVQKCPRSQKMPQCWCLLTKVGFDTAESEPSKAMFLHVLITPGSTAKYNSSRVPFSSGPLAQLAAPQTNAAASGAVMHLPRQLLPGRPLSVTSRLDVRYQVWQAHSRGNSRGKGAVRRRTRAGARS